MIAIDFNDHRGLLNLIKSNNNNMSYIDEDGNNLLIRAISKNSVECMEILMKHNIATNIQNKRNETPLHWACLNNLSELCVQLIKLQADVNAVNYQGITPLHCAARGGTSSIIKLLLKNNAQVDATTADGITPLMIACTGKRKTNGQILLHAGASTQNIDRYGRTPMHFVSQSENCSLLNEIINHRAPLNKKDYKGETPLHYAVKSCSVSKLKALLLYYQHISVNELNNEGKSALHILLLEKTDNAELIQLFINCSEVNKSLKWRNRTALDIACSIGNAQYVDILSSVLDDSDSQPFHISLINQRLFISFYLLNRKRTIEFLDNETSIRKESALHIIPRLDIKIKRAINLLKILLTYPEIQINRKNYQGNTPIHISCFYANIDCFNEFKNHPKCNLFEKNDKGRNILHCAVLGNNIQIVKSILELKDHKLLYCKDNDGNTPLHLANSIPIVQTLLNLPFINTLIENNRHQTPFESCIESANFTVFFLLLRHRQQYEKQKMESFYKERKKNNNNIYFNVSHIIPFINPQLWTASLVSCPILEEICDFQATNEYGMTPLLISAKLGANKSLRYLLQNSNVNYNFQDNNGWTAFHYASGYGKIECIKEILNSNKCNLTLVDDQGRSALHICDYSNVEIVQTILSSTNSKKLCRIADKKGNLPIHYICKVGNLNILKVLVDCDNFSNNISDVNLFLQQNQIASPLHIACYYGFIDIVSYLLDKITLLDINLFDPIHSYSPLMISIMNCDVKLTRLLLQCNAKINHPNQYGFTPLHMAAKAGNIEILELLIDQKGNVSVLDNDNNLPLHIALKHNQLECAQILISVNSPIKETVKSEKQLTIALLASKLGNPWICLHSLHSYGNQLLRSTNQNDQRNPLHFAAITGNLHSFLILTKATKSLKINILDKFGKTPLHYAVEYNHIDIVAFVIGMGGDLTIKCKLNGNTPLHYAAKNKNTVMYNFLLERGADENLLNLSNVSSCDLLNGITRGLRPRISSSCIQKVTSQLNTTASGWVSATIDLELAKKQTNNNNNDNTQENQQDNQPSQSNHRELKVKSPSISYKSSPFQKFMNVSRTSSLSPEKILTVTKNESNLCKAISKNDIESFSRCLSKQKKDLNFKDENGNTPLVLAVLSKNLQFVSDLLLAQANPNLNGENGINALCTAIEQDSKQCISLLLMHGANPNVTVGTESDTVLKLATIRGDVKLVQQLLSFNAAVDSQEGVMGHSALYVAAQHGHVNVVRTLLANGASVNIISKGNFLSPLHTACVAGHVECVKCLLEKNAQVDLQTFQKCSALHLSVGRDRFQQTCSILLDYKADINAVDEDGNSPLHLACLIGCPKDAEILLSKNPPAKIDLRSKIGSLPIHNAAFSGNSDLISLLIAKKADISAVDGKNRTPLHITCIHGHFESTLLLNSRLIIQQKANQYGIVNIKDNDNKIPLYYAIEKNHVDIVALLLGIKKEIRRQTIYSQSLSDSFNFQEDIGLLSSFYNMAIDYDENTVFHKIISYELNHCVEVLLTKNINLTEITNSFNETALLYACKLGISSTVRLLLLNNANYKIFSSNGSTALQLAIESNNIQTIKELLHYDKTIINLQNQQNQTNVFHWISKYPKISDEIVKFLSSLFSNSPRENNSSSSSSTCYSLFGINQIDNKNKTPLFYACKYGNLSMIHYLISNGANIQAEDLHKNTILLQTSKTENIEIMKVLLQKYKISITQKNQFQQNILHCACIGGHLKMIEFLLQQQNPIENQIYFNEIDKNGNNLLHLAILSKNQDICKYIALKKNGCLINVQNKYGETPLYLACKNKMEEMIFFLISNQAEINIQNEKGNSPLHICCKYGLVKSFYLLLKVPTLNLYVKNKKGRTILHYASKYSQLSIITILFQEIKEMKKFLLYSIDNNGMNVFHVLNTNNTNPTSSTISILIKQFPEGIIMKDKKGRIPFHHIITSSLPHHNDNMMKQILLPFIEFDKNQLFYRSLSNKTPLHYATISGKCNSIEYLLNHFDFIQNDHINDIDNLGFSSLHYSVLLNDYESTELLLDSGACLHLLCFKLLNSPLHIAIKQKDIKLIRLLIDYGANPNLKDINGNSSLHLACLHSLSEDCIELLLQNQCNLTLINNKGLTALEICILTYKNQNQTNQNENITKLDYLTEIIYLFYKFGYPIDYFNPFGIHFIHSACFIGSKNLISILLSLGVDINIPDQNNGLTPIMYAALGGHLELLIYLKSSGADFTLKTKKNQNLLHFAVKSKNQKLIHWILEEFSSLNLDSQIDSSIHNKLPYHDSILSDQKNYKISELLLKSYVTKTNSNEILNQKDSLGIYPIHWSSYICNFSLFAELLSKKSSLNVQSDSKKWNIIHFILSNQLFNPENQSKNQIEIQIDFLTKIHENYPNFMNQLIDLNNNENKTKINENYFHFISRLHGNNDLIEKFFDFFHACNKNEKLIDDVNDFHCSPLHYSIMCSSFSCLKYLISNYSNRISINSVDLHGNHILMKSFKLLHDYLSSSSPIYTLQVDIIHYLLEINHFDFFISNHQNESILHFACLFTNLNIVKKLIFCILKQNFEKFKLNSIDFNDFNDFNWSILSLSNHNLILDDILWKNIHPTCFYGSHVIHYCCFSGQIDLFDFLVSIGINIHVVDSFNANIFFYCIFGNQPILLEYLFENYLDQFCDPNHSILNHFYTGDSFNNLNIFQISASLGRFECIHVLSKFLPNGLSILTKDNESLLHLACKNNCIKCIFYLLNRASVDKSISKIDQSAFDFLQKTDNKFCKNVYLQFQK